MGLRVRADHVFGEVVAAATSAAAQGTGGQLVGAWRSAEAEVDATGKQRLEGAEVVRPRAGEVGGLDPFRKPMTHLGFEQAAQRPGERLLVARRHEQTVHPVDHLLCEGRDRGGEHGQTMYMGEHDVRGGRVAAVGQGEHVVVGQQRRQRLGRHVAVTDLDPADQPRIIGELADDLSAGPPQLTGDRQRDVRHGAHGPQQHVDALVLADQTQGEQANGPRPGVA